MVVQNTIIDAAHVATATMQMLVIGDVLIVDRAADHMAKAYQMNSTQSQWLNMRLKWAAM